MTWLVIPKCRKCLISRSEAEKIFFTNSEYNNTISYYGLYHASQTSQAI